MSEPEIVVRLERVCVRREGHPVLEDISFAVRRGQFAGLIGPNGAGKTTLLKAILGIVPLTTGRIEVLGSAPGERRQGPRGVGYVPQRHSVAPAFPATAADVVRMGRLPRSGWLAWSRPAEREAVAACLDRVGILHLRDRPIGELSGGEQRRVTLAQALCAGSQLLMLDEPTVGLDLPAAQEFYALLRQLQEELRLTVIAVSHDLLALAGASDHLICINRRMHVHGNPDEVVHSHALHEAYSCEYDFLAGEIDHHGRFGPGP